MGELLLKTGNYLFDTALNRMLTAAGLTLATASISVPVMNNLIARTRNNLTGLSDFGLAMVDLSGLDTAISLIISAILVRNTMNQARIFLAKFD